MYVYYLHSWNMKKLLNVVCQPISLANNSVKHSSFCQLTFFNEEYRNTCSQKNIDKPKENKKKCENILNVIQA